MSRPSALPVPVSSGMRVATSVHVFSDEITPSAAAACEIVSHAEREQNAQSASCRWTASSRTWMSSSRGDQPQILDRPFFALAFYRRCWSGIRYHGARSDPRVPLVRLDRIRVESDPWRGDTDFRADLANSVTRVALCGAGGTSMSRPGCRSTRQGADGCQLRSIFCASSTASTVAYHEARHAIIAP